MRSIYREKEGAMTRARPPGPDISWDGLTEVRGEQVARYWIVSRLWEGGYFPAAGGEVLRTVKGRPSVGSHPVRLADEVGENEPSFPVTPPFRYQSAANARVSVSVKWCEEASFRAAQVIHEVGR